MTTLEPVTLLLGSDYAWERAGDQLAVRITEAGMAKMTAAGYTGVLPVEIDVIETPMGVAPWITIQPLKVAES